MLFRSAHSSVWVVVVGIAVGYSWAFTRLGPRVLGPDVEVATSRQKAWIIAGVLFTWVFAEYPIHDIAERYLFSVHMIQHTVFTLVAPACFLLGTPAWLQQRILAVRPIGAAARFLAKPMIALVVFNGLVLFTHWPKLVERGLHNELIHFSIHLVLFLSALCMWFPVINRLPGYPRLKTPNNMLYLFAQSIGPTVPMAFLTFSGSHVLYRTYAEAPRMIRGLTAIGDQQIAAAIMKIGAGGLLWSVVGMLFVQWWRDSQNGQANDNRRRPAPLPMPAPVLVPAVTLEKPVDPDPDVLTWDQVQAEFDRLDAVAEPDR